ncbi:MAG: lactate utilization protein [Armatimonadota bacterium]|nr:lactate utilization protein [Armatimonadota bacterium]MDW8155326.1 lactate utilization protein [Armatimonadota bacterium]
MSSREQILRAVRAACGGSVELPCAGPPPVAAEYRARLASARVEVFVRRAQELGVQVHRVDGPERLGDVVAQLCQGRLTCVEPALRELEQSLAVRGVPLVGWDRLAEAEVGVAGADYAVAESATLVVLARPERPRSASLLPPVHVAVLPEDRVLADLFELVERVGDLPTAVVLASGPSRSADIEMSLAVGVHGPGTVHVVLVSAGQEAPGRMAK